MGVLSVPRSSSGEPPRQAAESTHDLRFELRKHAAAASIFQAGFIGLEAVTHFMPPQDVLTYGMPHCRDPKPIRIDDMDVTTLLAQRDKHVRLAYAMQDHVLDYDRTPAHVLAHGMPQCAPKNDAWWAAMMDDLEHADSPLADVNVSMATVTPIDLAVRSGNAVMVRKLIARGAQVTEATMAVAATKPEIMCVMPEV